MFCINVPGSFFLSSDSFDVNVLWAFNTASVAPPSIDWYMLAYCGQEISPFTYQTLEVQFHYYKVSTSCHYLLPISLFFLVPFQQLFTLPIFYFGSIMIFCYAFLSHAFYLYAAKEKNEGRSTSWGCWNFAIYDSKQRWNLQCKNVAEVREKIKILLWFSLLGFGAHLNYFYYFLVNFSKIKNGLNSIQNFVIISCNRFIMV